MFLPSPETLLFSFLSPAIIFVGLQLIKWYFKQKEIWSLARKMEKPPGYSCYPLIGHTHHLTNLENVLSISNSFKSPCGVLFLGVNTYFVLNHPDLFEDCLTSDKCLNKPHYFDIMEHIDGGLFMAKDNVWRSQKKLLSPGFKQRILHFYATKFTKHDERFLEQLNLKVDGEVFDINILSKDLSYRKFFDCAFGMDFNEKSQQYLDALDKSVMLSQSRMFSIFARIKLINKFMPSTKATDVVKKALSDITDDIIAARHEILKNKGQDEVIYDEECEEMNFIDYLLKCIETEKYDEKNLVAELITFIFAGVDTCSTTFSYLCICLSLYPEVQQKVCQEISQILGDRPFHYSDYTRFEYLHMVIKETLRLFPPGPIIHRETIDAVKIGEYIFPKNSILHIAIMNVQRSPKFYKDPLKFSPERFDPESEGHKKRHRFAYVPFSGGKRNCIGERFGLLSLVSTATCVLRRFRFETTYESVESIRLEQKFTLNAVEGFNVRMYRRH